MYYQSVYSAMRRAVSGISSSKDRFRTSLGLLAVAMIENLTEDTVAFVISTRTTSLGYQWELYVFNSLSQIVSVRGRIEHAHRRRKEKFSSRICLVGQGAMGTIRIHTALPLTEYIRMQMLVAVTPESLQMNSGLMRV